MKEIEEESNKWRAISCSWIGSLNIVKMPILSSNLMEAFQSEYIKLFCGYQQPNFKFTWNLKNVKRPRIVNLILKRKTES